MSEPAVEALVILDASDPQALEALRRDAVVTQFLPPRLALVALPLGTRVLKSRGATLYEHDVPGAVLDKLSENERLFVSAWASRRVAKERTGDHLPWDAPGYSPPDWPSIR